MTRSRSIQSGWEAICRAAAAQPVRVRVIQISALIALAASAWVRIPLPFTPVPLTLQTFVVFLAALLLGARHSLPVVAAYLALGMAGLPIFAGGHGGFGYLFGSNAATTGFLLGFLPAAWVIGTLVHRDEANLARDAAGLAAGVVVLFGFGACWLKAATGLPWTTVWATAVAPFLLVDACKAAAAYCISRLAGTSARS